MTKRNRMGLMCCFGGGHSEEKKEQERLASAEVAAKAAEAAQRRQEEFEKSAAGRAARAQQQAIAKQAANSNKGEPVLKIVHMFDCFVGFVYTVVNGMRLNLLSLQQLAFFLYYRDSTLFCGLPISPLPAPKIPYLHSSTLNVSKKNRANDSLLMLPKT
ncbi:hypothetical protein ACLB2K_009920 [Fragaria x ananassa]